MLTAYLAAAAAGSYVVVRWLSGLARARSERGIARVRVADLAGSVGSLVRFAHPTRRRERVEGRLLGVRESLLSLAWYRVEVKDENGSVSVYEVGGRRWAEVASAAP